MSDKFFLASFTCGRCGTRHENVRSPIGQHGFSILNPDACSCGASPDPLRVGRIRELEAENAQLRDALTWYGEQARLCRLIHSEGDTGRHALDADGGRRASDALKGSARPAAPVTTAGEEV